VTEIRIKRQVIEPGMVMAITHERGRFKYKYATYSKDGRLSLTFVGGPPGHYCWRSFRPERVKKIFPGRE